MRVNEDDVEYDDEGRALYEGEPFTGEVIEHSAEGWALSSNNYFLGVPDGPCTEWYGPAQIAKQGEMKDGRPIRTHREWHANGQVAVERVFGDGGDLQSVRRWDEAGEPISAVVDELFDVEDTWLEECGRRFHDGGLVTGDVVTRDADGRVIAVLGYVVGIPSGPQITWYPNGQKMSEGACALGLAVGEWTRWHPDGRTAKVQTFGERGRRM